MHCKEEKPYIREEAIRIAYHSLIPDSFVEGIGAIIDRECRKEPVLKLFHEEVLYLCLPVLAYGIAVGIRQERERRREHENS